jgi:alpha-D-ribose 1-methylphosphonate 5-triphosphate diphosphatase
VNSDCLSLQRPEPQRAAVRGIRREAHPAFALRNARVVLPNSVETTSLLLRDALIQRIGETIPGTPHTIDCEGDFVIPGLIEPHTDNLERHLEPRPGTFWNASRAILSHDAELASAGITTALDAVTLGGDVGSGIAQIAYLDAISASVSALSEALFRVDHLLHLRCELSSPQLSEHLEQALERRIPRLLSLMDHTPGRGQWTDIESFREHYIGRYGLRGCQIDELIVRRQRARAEFAASNRRVALEMAFQYQCILASHDDATSADIEQAHLDSCSIAEFPTSLEAARAAQDRRMRIVVGAPNLVRGGSHSGNVAASELVQEGLYDMLSSDYCPSSLLEATFMLAGTFGVPLPQAVAKVTSTPAQILRLSDRGSIVEGKRADLVRVRDSGRGPVVVSVWCGGRQVA